MEQIKIAYFYIETDGESKSALYAVEEVGGFKKAGDAFVDGPPRLFKVITDDKAYTKPSVSLEEVNYR